MVRDLRPPVAPPFFARLLYDEGELIGVLVVVVADRPEGEVAVIQVTLGIAARVDRRRGERLGDELMDEFDRLVASIAEDAEISSAELIAELHRKNEPVRRLLQGRGWSPSGLRHGDVQYQYWSARWTSQLVQAPDGDT
jgi:hypothetical protein